MNVLGIEVYGLSIIPNPEFYKGWMVQPLLDGNFSAYPRTDTNGKVGAILPSFGAALDYVDEEVARGV